MNNSSRVVLSRSFASKILTLAPGSTRHNGCATVASRMNYSDASTSTFSTDASHTGLLHQHHHPHPSAPYAVPDHVVDELDSRNFGYRVIDPLVMKPKGFEEGYDQYSLHVSPTHLKGTSYYVNVLEGPLPSWNCETHCPSMELESDD